jgi:hypothetical protein
MRRQLFVAVVAAFAWVFAALVVPAPSLAADVYIDVPIKSLTFTGGATLDNPTTGPAAAAHGDLMFDRIVIDGAVADGYILAEDSSGTETMANLALSDHHVVIRAGDGSPMVTGTLYAPNTDFTAMAAVHFSVNAAEHAGTRKAFLKGQMAYYEHLWHAGLPGAAFFRQRALAARRELGDDAPADTGNRFWRQPGAVGLSDDEVDETFGFFSGGRAVSENLQLDRALNSSTQPAAADVKIADITGVTTHAFDWKPLVKDLHPQTDPLAAIIPADQHAIFFSSFQASIDLADRADQQLSPFIRTLESAAGDAQTRRRYERQLCLSMTQLGRFVGPSVINSVAITGSDPYWRVGSDIAIVFEAKDVKTLTSLLDAQQAMKRATEPQASPVNGEISPGISYTGLVSRDRSVCSYIATIGPAVVVSNSLVQLKNLAAAQQGTSPSLASTPEYTFFRDRYRRGDADETALFVLSDQTIRRWCSPRWRIGDSRRTRAAAVMSDLQSAHAKEIALASAEPQPLKPEQTLPGLESLSLEKDGVASPTYGSLQFMTPIAELELTSCTQDEQKAYERWRTGYESNFHYFDPIALRIALKPASIAADLTVMPLVVNSDYQTVVEITKGVRLEPTSADPHDAVAQVAAAINPKSEPVVSLTHMAQMFGGQAVQVDPFAWLGHSLSLYADDDGFWDELAKADEPDEFVQKHIGRLPVALYVESNNPLKLAAFLTALHAFADQSAPNLTMWDTLKHGDTTYVKIAPAAGAPMDEWQNLAIYYAAMPRALIVSLNEGVLTRAIDRELARTAHTTTGPVAADDQPPTTRPIKPWLGESYCLHLTARFLQSVTASGKTEMQTEAQDTAWRNAPILNEFRRLLPDQDPVQAYSRVFGVTLIDGAGGKYEWDPQWQTMQSSVYGSPAQPKTGPTVLDSIQGMGGNFGITFEHDGLRGRAEVELPQAH